MSREQRRRKQVAKAQARLRKTIMLISAIFIIVMMGLLVLSQKRANDFAAELKNYDRNLLSSDLAATWHDEKLAQKYSRAILFSVYEQIPPELTALSQQVGKPFRPYLQEVLSGDVFAQQLEIIQQGKRAAQQGARLTITVIPDWHSDTLNFSQDQASVYHQISIRNYILNRNLPIVFAEGICSEYNRENVYKDLVQLSQELNKKPLTREEFNNIDFAGMVKEDWMSGFIDDPYRKIVGVDDLVANHLVQVLMELAENPIFTRTGKSDYTSFNLAWRSQLIMAKTILEIRRRHLTQGYLVVGALHLQSLVALANEWGFNLQVESLGLENFPGVVPEIISIIKSHKTKEPQ